MEEDAGEVLDAGAADAGPPPLGIFRPAATLAGPRAQASAVRLFDGKVLIVGGLATSLSGLATAEVYDPVAEGVAGHFSPTASLTEPRAYPSATLLADGRVLVVGDASARAELYLPSNDAGVARFVPTGDLHQALVRPKAVRLSDGRVLVLSLGNAPGSPELFDPSADGGAGAFSPTGAMHFSRTGATAVLLRDGRVLVAGGTNSVTGPLETAELFDPTANDGQGGFLSTASMKGPRVDATANLLPDGRVLIAGGFFENAPVAQAELFDPSVDGGLFVKGPAMVAPRGAAVSAVLDDGSVLIVGGAVNGVFHAVSRSERFVVGDGGQGEFTLTGSLMTGRHTMTATLLNNGELLVAGGQTDGHVESALSTAERFLLR